MKVARWEARHFFCVYKGRWASVCTNETIFYCTNDVFLRYF